MTQEYIPIPGEKEVGAVGETAPAFAAEVGGVDPSGNLQPLLIDNSGNLKTSGNVSGSVTVSGLKNGLTITTLTVTDVLTALPATPRPLRNSISVMNKGSDILYIGDASVTAGDAIGTTSGWDVFPGDIYNTDITDAIILYGIASAGKTILVKVFETS